MVVRQDVYPIALRYRQQLLSTICRLHAVPVPALPPEAAAQPRPEVARGDLTASVPVAPKLVYMLMSIQP
jgi:hypothetical protein